jgi:hypothetical protein
LATVAVKTAADAPDGTVTDDGTETAALLLLNDTVNPAPGAAEFKLTVHVSVPAPVMLCFVQTRDCRLTSFRLFIDETGLTAEGAAHTASKDVPPPAASTSTNPTNAPGRFRLPDRCQVVS